MPNLERERIRALEQQIADRDHFISELLASRSWKITRPLRWLHARLLKIIRRRIASDSRSEAASGVASTPELIQSKGALSGLARAGLKAFLASGVELILPRADDPELSIVLVVYNRAEFTLRCLSSLMKNAPSLSEIIVVDNASQDETGDLLDQVQGARIIRNEENRHYIMGANQGAEAARGQYLLFLNNDSEVLTGSIESALDTLKSGDNIGAVGGKLILPDGTLQEAGSIVWQNGSCVAYGRGGDPFSPPFMFRRDVDFCSAAFLLTKRDTFLNSGGFDEAFRPAYYEDADYCFKLRRGGHRIVYDPGAAVVHYEFGSSESSEDAIQLQIRNRGIFVTKHAEDLKSHPVSGNRLEARSSRKPFQRILYIDDRVPHPWRGSGFPRAHAILNSLVRMNCFVSLYPMSYINEDWSSVYSDIPRDVEVILGSGRSFLESFLAERKGYYDTILVSRPQNIQIVQGLRKRRPELFDKLRLIYDAEALFSMRDVTRRRLEGQEISEKELAKMIQNEMEMAVDADVVLTASEQEREVWMQSAGHKKIDVLGHTMEVQPGDTSFEEREGFLFVGAIQDDTSPNADAVRWFIQEIFPRIQEKLGPRARFTVAGINHSDTIMNLGSSEVTFAGYRDELTDLYAAARIFVAPSRIAAGLPLKVYDAAAHGIPVVATSVLGSQLGWTDGREIMLADSAATFAEKCIQLYQDSALWRRIRESALDVVRKDCSPASFDAKLRSILS